MDLGQHDERAWVTSHPFSLSRFSCRIPAAAKPPLSVRPKAEPNRELRVREAYPFQRRLRVRPWTEAAEASTPAQRSPPQVDITCYVQATEGSPRRGPTGAARIKQFYRRGQARGVNGPGRKRFISAGRFVGTGATLARPAAPARSRATREAPDDAWGGWEEANNRRSVTPAPARKVLVAFYSPRRPATFTRFSHGLRRHYAPAPKIAILKKVWANAATASPPDRS